MYSGDSAEKEGIVPEHTCNLIPLSRVAPACEAVLPNPNPNPDPAGEALLGRSELHLTLTLTLTPASTLTLTLTLQANLHSGNLILQPQP